MNKGIKNTLVFIAGAGVGATAATLYLRNFYTKFINETLNDEVNKQMDKIKQEYNEAVEQLRKQYECEIPVEEPKEEEKPKTKPVKKTKEQKKEEATDYTQFSEEKKGKKTVKDVKKEAMEQIQEENTNDDGTYIITFNDYTEDNGYEKVTSTYYAGNNVYTNDYDDPDPDMPHIAGNLMEKFDDYGEGNSLYLRNDIRQTDYEIIFDEGSYGE